MKLISTTIRVCIDGRTWSEKMTTMEFISKCKRQKFKFVEICEVVDQEVAKQMILEGLITSK